MRAVFVRRLHRVRFVLIVAGLCLGVGGVPAAQGGESLLPRLGVTRGLCVVLGDPTGDVAVQLARDSELLIYVQLPRAEDVGRGAASGGGRGIVRHADLRRTGRSGAAVPGRQSGRRADRDRRAAGVPEAEVLRVLRPQGKAILGGRELVKPVPAGVDDWSHPYHGPDNNPAVARPAGARPVPDAVPGRSALRAAAAGGGGCGRAGVQGVRPHRVQDARRAVAEHAGRVQRLQRHAAVAARDPAGADGASQHADRHAHDGLLWRRQVLQGDRRGHRRDCATRSRRPRTWPAARSGNGWRWRTACCTP